ncbi:penicillin-binding protein activator LpoB [Sphingomonas sp. XMGL2]|uniref:Penicillin-binding protein activator LpoB n=2 Tax=Sphingomonas quercus TaxID=2842451 RepID=A0ABS6BFJ4_9SPHN|nr:penicillin-binding protein activator LpoB [Sphingomonas quercus]
MLCLAMATPSLAADESSGRKLQQKGQQEIPICTKKLGTLMIVEPETKWWTQVGLGSPEAIIKLFVTKSGCFGLVDRGRGLASRAVERALADSGELQQNSNIGKGQVKAADYAMVPDIITGNNNSGGTNIGAALGGFLGRGVLGGIAGGLNIKKKEANVTLAVVNMRTTEQEALTEGYARKTDIGFGGGAGGWFGGGLAAAGAGSYQNTDLGQVVVLAYLDAYTKLVTQLGGLPANASAAAPVASK